MMLSSLRNTKKNRQIKIFFGKNGSYHRKTISNYLWRHMRISYYEIINMTHASITWSISITLSSRNPSPMSHCHASHYESPCVIMRHNESLALCIDYVIGIEYVNFHELFMSSKEPSEVGKHWLKLESFFRSWKVLTEVRKLIINSSSNVMCDTISYTRNVFLHLIYYTEPIFLPIFTRLGFKPIFITLLSFWPIFLPGYVFGSL